LHSISVSLCLSVSPSVSLSSRRPFSRVSRVRLFSRLVSSHRLSRASISKNYSKQSTKTTRILFL
jgi:hypothetical protein